MEMCTHFHCINSKSNVPSDRTSLVCSVVVSIYFAVDSTDEHFRVLLHLPMYVYFFNRPIRHVEMCFKLRILIL